MGRFHQTQQEETTGTSRNQVATHEKTAYTYAELGSYTAGLSRPTTYRQIRSWGKKVEAMSNISAEDIRNGRERKMMTQQELADEVGVSLRTVSSWERGETVPRNRLGVIAEVLGLEGAREFGREALIRQLGRLAKQRREEIGLGRPAFAKEAGLGSDKTVASFEFGRVLPSGVSQRKIEKALGWRLGIIDECMRMVDRKASTIDMTELDAEDSLYLAAQGGISSLALVSDDDLLAEVRRRMSSRTGRNLSRDAQDIYGLAASTNVEHIEDEDGEGTAE